MADPIKWRSTIILAKLEETYGVDPTPTGAANAILMTDVQLSPMEGEEVSRELELPYLGGQDTIVVALRAVLTGSVELAGSGANGVAPAWGPLLRACAVAETVTPESEPEAGDGEVVYNPVSDDHENLTIYVWKGNTQHKLVGARGTAEMIVEANGIPRIRFTFTGIWTQPAEVARPTPVLSGWRDPFPASTLTTPLFEIAETPFVLRSLAFNLGNDVQHRLLIGRDAVLIVDREEELRATIEAAPVTLFNPYALARNKTRVPLIITHTDPAGGQAIFEAPACTVGRLTGYENQQNITEWPLTLRPLPTAGDDQWTLTLI